MVVEGSEGSKILLSSLRSMDVVSQSEGRWFDVRSLPSSFQTTSKVASTAASRASRSEGKSGCWGQRQKVKSKQIYQVFTWCLSIKFPPIVPTSLTPRLPTSSMWWASWWQYLQPGIHNPSKLKEQVSSVLGRLVSRKREICKAQLTHIPQGQRRQQPLEP